MPSIDIKVTADNRQVVRQMRETERQVTHTAQMIKRSGENVDGFFTTLGRNFDQMKNNMVAGLKSIAAGVVGFQAMGAAVEGVKALVDSTAELHRTMKEISTISQDVTDDLEGYERQILELTANVPIGATDAAKALYQIISAGQQGADAMHVLEVAAKAAIGGVTTTATAADTLTTLLNAYHMSAKEAEKVSDMLFTTVRLGKTNMTELGASIATVAPTAAAYGISLEDLLAAVASLTKQGTPTAIAMTQLNAVITQAVNSLGDGAFVGRSFRDALSEIADKADGSMTALKGDISNVRAMKAVLQLTGDSAGMAAKDLEDMGNAAGAANAAFEKMFDTQAAQRLRNNVQAYIQPAMNEIHHARTELMNGLSEAMESGAVKEYMAALEGVIAAYGVYRTSVVVATMLKSTEVAAWSAATAAERRWYVQTLLAEKAQALLNKTMLANPYVAAAAAIGALAGSLIYLANRTDAATLAKRNLDAAYADENDNAEELLRTMSSLVDVAASQTATDDERQSAMDTLNSRYSELLKNYTDEEGHLKDILALKEAIAAQERDQNIDKAREDLAALERDVKKLEQAKAAKWNYSTMPTMGTFIQQIRNRYQQETGEKLFKNDRVLEYYRAKLESQRQSLMEQIASGNQPQPTPPGGGPVSASMTEEDKQKLKQARQDQEKLEDLREQQARERTRAAEDQELAIAQARIKAMEEGAERTRAELELEHRREMAAIEREQEDMVIAREAQARALWEAENAASIRDTGLGWRGSGARERWIAFDSGLTVADKAYLNARSQAAATSYDRELRNAMNHERETMREFLKEYGDYQQKRAALAEEYSEKIARAETQGEANMAAAELQRAFGQLDMEELSESIDWESVFGNLDNLTTDYLKELHERLRKALDMGEISAENARVITTQMQQLDEAIERRKGVFSQLFGNNDLMKLITNRSAMKKRIEEAAEMEAAARRKVAEREAILEGQRTMLYGTLKKQGYKGSYDSVTSANSQNIIDMIGQSEELQKAFANLARNEQALASSTQNLSKAQGKLNTLSKAGGGAGGTLGWIDTIINYVNTRVQSNLKLNEELGVSETYFGRGYSKFAESSQYATNAWNSLKSGDFSGVYAGVLGSLRTLGETLGEWGLKGFGYSDRDLQDDLRKLAVSNEALTRAMDRLGQEMEKTGVSESYELYQKQLEAQEAVSKNLVESMVRAGANNSKGFLGIGGKHSSNYYIDQALSRDDWDRLSEVTGMTIGSASELWSLTADQWGRIATYASDLMGKIKSSAAEGKAGENPAQYIDEYIANGEVLDKLRENYLQRVTSLSFDEIKSEYRSLLSSMETTNQDWADSLEDKLRKAVINSLESDYDKQLQEWYHKFAKAASTGLTPEAAEMLRDEYNALVGKYQQQRDERYAALGIKDSSGAASATINAAMSITEDTANDLVGRATALQLGQERQSQVMMRIAESLERMASGGEILKGNGLLSEIRDLMASGTAYLETMTRQGKSMLEVLDKRLSKIEINTGKL